MSKVKQLVRRKEKKLYTYALHIINRHRLDNCKNFQKIIINYKIMNFIEIL